jgi:tetratricopeptide (TPR) repeat protein
MIFIDQMKKLLTGVLLFISLLASAQDYQARIYDVYLRGRMDLWKEIMEQMKREATDKNDLKLLYELTEVQYGYIGYCLSMKEKKEAERVLVEAEERAKFLLEKKVYEARLYSLVGAFYGYWVSLKPLRAPHFGSKSEEANRKALELDPEEPQAWMEKGNIAFYKPAMFGGSKSEAVPYYEKAVRLFEAGPPWRTRQNWVYLNCMAGLGIAYEETGQPEKAGELYKKILRMEPTFKWVKDELYPEYIKKHSR